MPHMLEDGIDTSGEGLLDSEGNLQGAKGSPSSLLPPTADRHAESLKERSGQWR